MGMAFVHNWVEVQWSISIAWYDWLHFIITLMEGCIVLKQRCFNMWVQYTIYSLDQSKAPLHMHTKC